jgi:hypothetical protein
MQLDAGFPILVRPPIISCISKDRLFMLCALEDIGAIWLDAGAAHPPPLGSPSLHDGQTHP